MKSNFLLLASFLLSFSAFAQSDQQDQSTNLVSMAKLEVGLHGVGVGYEFPFSHKWALNLSAGLGGGYYIEKNSFANGFNSNFILTEPVAYFRSELKYTYNRDKRLSKSKSLRNNAGNYVAYQAKYTTARVFESDDSDALNRTLLNEMHWGMQRPLGQKFLYNFHLGLGYGADFDSENSQLYPAVGLQFAFILYKHKSL